jgi:hypothetical protein
MMPANVAGHQKVLIVSQGAPGVGRDANSIMLQRLLVTFPEGSYVVLASSKNWPYRRVPDEPSMKAYHCFRNSIPDRPAPQWEVDGSGAAARSSRRSVRSLLYGILRIAKVLLLDPITVIVQTTSATVQAQAIARSENVTSVLAVSDSGPCLMAGWVASRKVGIPLDIYMFDLWKENVFPPLQSALACVFQHRVFASARNVFAAGTGMGEYLRATYKLPVTVVANICARQLDCGRGNGTVRDPKVITYAGSVDWPQADALLDLVAAVNGIDGWVLQVYSLQSRAILDRRGISGNHVVLCGPLRENEVQSHLTAADLLFVPMTFQRRGTHIIETAQPAKSVDYMASGVPVLIHAPPYAFVARYAREWNTALVADQAGPDQLRHILADVAAGTIDASRQAANACLVVKEKHDPAKESALLQSCIFASASDEPPSDSGAS